MTHQRRIVFVTCRAWPELSASDAELATELQSRGHSVVAEPWNVASVSTFTDADLVVLRSNWDYHHELQEFEEWLNTVAASPGELRNDATLVRDHLHKRYLLRLAGHGVPTPSTLVLETFDTDAIRDWASAEQLDRIVLKPAWGASGHHVQLVEVQTLDEERLHWKNDERRDLLAQGFVPEVLDGEVSLVFFANNYSHALLRRPAPGDFRANSDYGSQMVLAQEPDPAMIEIAQHALSTLGVIPTYARVDLVGSGDNVTLMELEINEPALGLHLASGAAVRFADALVGPVG